MKSIYSFILFMFVCSSAYGLHVKNGEGKIGNKAVLDYTVKMFIVSTGEANVCTGTFLDEKTILTAAHCIYDDKTGSKLLTVAIPEFNEEDMPMI